MSQVGVDLSRSKVYYFKHNDLADLELVLKKIAKDDARLGRDVTKQVGGVTTNASTRARRGLQERKPLLLWWCVWWWWWW